MEYRVVQLKGEIATGKVIESHWTLTHADGPHSAYRYGMVTVPDDYVAFGTYSTVTEQQAIDNTKAILGDEYIANLEQSCLDEIQMKANPTTIQGLPWAPPPPPIPTPSPPPSPAPSPEPAPPAP